MALLPFARVTLVLRHQRGIRSLPHVARVISAFLGLSPNLTLARACSFGSLALLDRMWQESCASSHDRTPWWALGNFLRSDRHYYRWQFSQGLEQAARHGHLHVVEWLFAHFSGCQASIMVVEAAAEAGHLAILQYLHAHAVTVSGWGGQGTQLQEDDAQENPNNGIQVCWGRGDMTKAAQSGHTEIDDAIATAAVGGLAVGGHLEMMKRVEVLNPPRQWRWCHSLSEAVVAACRHGHLAVVHWLLEQHDVREAFSAETSLGMHMAAVNGHIELAQYLFAHGFSGCSRATMLHAAANGHFRVVQWLHSQFGNDSSGSGLFWNGHESPSNVVGRDKESAAAIDAAAARGHLDVVVFLHSLTVVTNPQGDNNAERASDDGGGGRRPWATHMAMDEAAKHGHLHVIQWLFANRTEGCTTDAMDNAAGEGHLDVVQWLHANTKVGCTEDAMDFAACNGHLEVVQWLHSNRSEGCTTYAMDDAALSGHLYVVKWLHDNRFEGCTEKAVENAIGNSHLSVVLWLLAHYPKYVNAGKAVWNDIEWVSFEMLLLMHSQYPEVMSQETEPGVRSRAPGHIGSWVEEHYPSHYM
ncbi:hypothetical protein BBJ28_00016616 [Nothophytophthora sp. Chile5]|nr:hypothetical protein BBJ28_00016616 [Nothophytophthora sp. Chile5]